MYVVRCAVDDFDFEVAIRLGANGSNVHVRNIGKLVGGESLGGFVNLVCYTLWSRTAVG